MCLVAEKSACIQQWLSFILVNNRLGTKNWLQAHSRKRWTRMLWIWFWPKGKGFKLKRSKLDQTRNSSYYNVVTKWTVSSMFSMRYKKSAVQTFQSALLVCAKYNQILIFGILLPLGMGYSGKYLAFPVRKSDGIIKVKNTVLSL